MDDVADHQTKCKYVHLQWSIFYITATCRWRWAFSLIVHQCIQYPCMYVLVWPFIVMNHFIKQIFNNSASNNTTALPPCKYICSELLVLLIQYMLADTCIENISSGRFLTYKSSAPRLALYQLHRGWSIAQYVHFMTSSSISPIGWL